MQTRLEIKRFPTMIVAILFALAVTMTLGGTLGYLLKPATVVSGPERVIVVPSQTGGLSSNDNSCVSIHHLSAC